MLTFAMEAVINLCGCEEGGSVWWWPTTLEVSAHRKLTFLCGVCFHVDIHSHCVS